MPLDDGSGLDQAEISLTDFVDIVHASGTPKATKVRTIKNRDPYDPRFDFYRPLRGRIIEAIREQRGRDHLRALLADLDDNKKKTNYPSALDGLCKWWGRKDITWFEPSRDRFHAHGVSVRVNPELGVVVNGEPHLVKLYFKDSRLTKTGFDIIGQMLDHTLRPVVGPDVRMSVLDVRRGKLFSPTVPIKDLAATLDAELAYIGALWRQL